MTTEFLEPGKDIEVFLKGEKYPTLLAKWYCSFFPLLFKALALTDGDVLELGTGIYSTPFLHWYCLANKRHLVSYENAEPYIAHAKQYVENFHKVYGVGSYLEAELGKAWDVAFIDSFPEEQRVDLVKQLAGKTKYIIVHDSFPKMYEGLCKYRFDCIGLMPNTTIFSNFIDLSNFKI